MAAATPPRGSACASRATLETTAGTDAPLVGLAMAASHVASVKMTASVTLEPAGVLAHLDLLDTTAGELVTAVTGEPTV